MLNPQANRSKILGAVAEDMLSEVLSTLSPLPIPTSTIKALTSALTPVWLRPEYYLRWDDLGYIANYYYRVWPDTLKFRYENQTYSIPQIMIIDNSQADLPLGKIQFRPISSTFTLDAKVTGLTEDHFRKYRQFLRFKRKSYKNGLLLRLSDIVHSQDITLFRVQPVRYEVVCRTNLCLDAKFENQKRSLRDTIHQNGELEPLNQSFLANPMGINCILFTADGKLIMPRRASRVIIRPNQLSPSFSGDFEATDVSRIPGGLETIHVLREGFEELGVLDEYIPEGRIHFLGLGRELVRGGKPEMFFEAHTTLTKEQLLNLHKDAVDSWEFQRRGWVFWPFDEAVLANGPVNKGRFELRQQFEALLRQEGHRISIPLLTNIVLWMLSKLGGSFDM